MTPERWHPEAYPESYEAVEPGGKEIDCEPGESVSVGFRLRAKVDESPNDANATSDPPDKPSAETIKVSGSIVLADGSPVTTKGWLYSETTIASGDGSAHAFRTVGQFTHHFSIEVPAGTVWLKYYGDGFAPAWVVH